MAAAARLSRCGGGRRCQQVRMPGGKCACDERERIEDGKDLLACHRMETIKPCIGPEGAPPLVTSCKVGGIIAPPIAASRFVETHNDDEEWNIEMHG